MRITQDNINDLISAIDEMETALEVRSACDDWINAQDEPKNEDVREDIRNAREEIESGIDALRDAAESIIDLVVPKKERATAKSGRADVDDASETKRDQTLAKALWLVFAPLRPGRDEIDGPLTTEERIQVARKMLAETMRLDLATIDAAVKM